MKASKETVTIDLQNYTGRYWTLTKTFNDQKHLDNWIRLMRNKGVKVIGIS